MRRTNTLLVALDRGSGTPLHAQIEFELRTGIQSGRLAPNTAIPSSRALARDLGVSRGVVVEAYDQLIAEGYLVARQGSATQVASAGRASSLEMVLERPAERFRYDFRPGVPALPTFPRADWLASIRRVLRETPASTFGYGDPRGSIELRQALAGYLGRVRGVLAEPSRIVVCSGFAQGLVLVCEALVQLGAHRVGLEDPCHAGQRAIVARAGLEPIGVPVDGGGVRTDVLTDLNPDALLVTPAHQFPMGVALAPDRRAELCAWAARQDAVVIEDDYDAEYRYDREPIGALQGLAPERVIYAGSVSKTLAPALRLGWLVVPSWMAARLAEAKANDDLGSPTVEQLALADFISGGRLDRHLRRHRAEYRRRRDTLVAALNEQVPHTDTQGIAAGLHLVVRLRDGVDEAALVAEAAKESVGVYPMGDYRFPGSFGPPAILLGYGGVPAAAIDPGIRRLARALAAVQ